MRSWYHVNTQLRSAEWQSLLFRTIYSPVNNYVSSFMSPFSGSVPAPKAREHCQIMQSGSKRYKSHYFHKGEFRYQVILHYRLLFVLCGKHQTLNHHLDSSRFDGLKCMTIHDQVSHTLPTFFTAKNVFRLIWIHKWCLVWISDLSLYY